MADENLETEVTMDGNSLFKEEMFYRSDDEK